jgi:hypothetical protein
MSQLSDLAKEEFLAEIERLKARKEKAQSKYRLDTVRQIQGQINRLAYTLRTLGKTKTEELKQ